MAFIWLVLLALSYIFNKVEVAAINSVYGLWFGFELFTENFILGLFIFLFNIWILFESIGDLQ